MSYDIIVRFPNKGVADAFMTQMMDGWGEGFCDFTWWLQKPGATGKEREDYEKVVENGKLVCFVNELFEG